jgi:hypothetical protein
VSDRRCRFGWSVSFILILIDLRTPARAPECFVGPQEPKLRMRTAWLSPALRRSMHPTDTGDPQTPHTAVREFYPAVTRCPPPRAPGRSDSGDGRTILLAVSLVKFRFDKRNFRGIDGAGRRCYRVPRASLPCRRARTPAPDPARGRVRPVRPARPFRRWERGWW